jgi:hypothetical protein
MNGYQGLWWEQARSDHAVLLLLRRQGAASCHLLHYLQMVTEKLGKAYFWRSGTPPRTTHAWFVKFLRSLGSVPASERQQIAAVFEFARFDDLQNWIRASLPLAYQLERLAPTLAQDGPNPEYPWPHTAPKHAPATFNFDIWTQLTGTGRGRQLMQVIDVAVKKFPSYGSRRRTKVA